MTRQPDLLAGLRELAPEWATWFCVDNNGVGWMQLDRGFPSDRGYWEPAKEWRAFPDPDAQQFEPGQMFAIELSTGTVHWQQPDGSIIEVTRSEWEAMP